VRDTGPQLFMAGAYYYRQIEDLSLCLCVAKKITDANWREFLQGSVQLSKDLGHHATVTMTAFVHAYPSPVQRRLTVEFLAKSQAPTVVRMGLVSDNSFVRGAIIALNWIIPKAKVRSFASRDASGCLNWLHEVAKFDVPTATEAWNDARRILHVE
jgi:hypothetical protein